MPATDHEVPCLATLSSDGASASIEIKVPREVYDLVEEDSSQSLFVKNEALGTKTLVLDWIDLAFVLEEDWSAS